ncbi:uncharacterized protein G2W53_023588 [Senna tora]|uniref:Transmembrane protein n=1 Tax=Senna tora TaxID=362788 RepID=A0A834WEM4_9FABA|nr:uncharacterized protein G2W53_023588 [Senna tora]
MGWHRIWMQKAKEYALNFVCPLEVFHLFALTILSLLLPTSFLLLARLSGFHYYLQTLPWLQYSYPSLYLFSLVIRINPNILFLLLSILTIATLIQSFTSKITLLTHSSTSVLNPPPLYASWILLCTFQICVGFGIEGSIAVGVYDSDSDYSSFGFERSFLSRLIFLLGLHETTQVWSRMVVKPVVDDTVFGNSRKERWVERAAVAASLGGLWWWRLREEVETLVLMAEVKTEQLMDVEMDDFVGWWLYYLTVTIGMVRIVKGLMWMIMMSLCRRRAIGMNSMDEPSENDQKV